MAALGVAIGAAAVGVLLLIGLGLGLIGLGLGLGFAALARRRRAASEAASQAERARGEGARNAAARVSAADHRAPADHSARESYFHALVSAVTDVVLLCRDGYVDDATPSARAMFGREVSGLRFDDLVEYLAVEPPDGASGSASGMASGGGDETPGVRAGVEGQVRRPDGSRVAVVVQRRDLTADEAIHGVVMTLRDVTVQRELQRSLAYRSSHDPLTGLANAELLRDRLRADRERSVHDGLTVALFIDLDDFKEVNDTYGTEVGDGLLITVARRIQAGLRGEDLAARLGGDEFAVLLRDVPDPTAAHAAAQRIADVLARPARVAGIEVDSGASIGLAIAQDPADFDSLLRRADTALYEAKTGGKGGWRQYADGMVSPVRRRADVRDELEQAIRDDALTLHYQPIVELATGRAVGFEALIRLNRGIAAQMRPEDLIAVAEGNALIISLGDWILRRALADVALLNHSRAGSPCYVSVNVSARQLRQPGFAAMVREHLAAAGVAGSQLVLEVTENVMLTEDERAWSRLADLRRDGVRVAIDDYGTGYASLSYLRQPAIDIVKIDRSFLFDLTSRRPQVLLEAVIALSTKLGLQQIAEGVEDEATSVVLQSLGCRYGQGYRYAPALPAVEADRWGPR